MNNKLSYVIFKNIFHKDEEMKKENLTSSSSKDLLVLGLDRDGEIVQFDRKCQRVTGYSRDQVLHKKIWDLLIPKSYTKQWKQMFEHAITHDTPENFKIPWIGNDGKQIIITGSFVPLETNKGLVRNICFIGKCIDVQEEQKILFKPDTPNNTVGIKEIPKKIKTKPLRIHTVKKKIKKEKQPSSKQKQEKKKTIASLENISSLHLKSTKKMSMEANIFMKKYDKLQKKLLELEKRDRVLERRNKLLEKNIKNLQDQLKTRKISHFYHKNNNVQSADEIDTLRIEKPIRWDPFGFKQKKSDILQKERVLDEKKKQLDSLASQLLNERKNLDSRLAKFSNWKEKLVGLETEIEKRRKSLLDKEQAFEKKYGALEPKPKQPEKNTSIEDTDYHSVLDRIPGSAAIIQRGILRQINSSFADMIGRDMKDLKNKSLFDFIAPEGLFDIEHYYLNRLKGKDETNYETIISTKENDRISVEVTLRPTFYKGEKAEFAVFNEIRNIHNMHSEEKEEVLESEESTIENESVSISDNEEKENTLEKIIPESEPKDEEKITPSQQPIENASEEPPSNSLATQDIEENTSPSEQSLDHQEKIPQDTKQEKPPTEEKTEEPTEETSLPVESKKESINEPDEESTSQEVHSNDTSASESESPKSEVTEEDQSVGDVNDQKEQEAIDAIKKGMKEKQEEKEE